MGFSTTQFTKSPIRSKVSGFPHLAQFVSPHNVHAGRKQLSSAHPMAATHLTTFRHNERVWLMDQLILRRQTGAGSGWLDRQATIKSRNDSHSIHQLKHRQTQSSMLSLRTDIWQSAGFYSSVAFLQPLQELKQLCWKKARQNKVYSWIFHLCQDECRSSNCWTRQPHHPSQKFHSLCPSCPRQKQRPTHFVDVYEYSLVLTMGRERFVCTPSVHSEIEAALPIQRPEPAAFTTKDGGTQLCFVWNGSRPTMFSTQKLPQTQIVISNLWRLQIFWCWRSELFWAVWKCAP